MSILVTGSSGFIGASLCVALHNLGRDVRPVVRDCSQIDPDNEIKKIANNELFEIGNISSKTDWNTALCGVDQVVHLAARVHVMHDINKDSLTEFYRINVAGTINLAKQAAFAGVKRFVFLSSIKVNGEFTEVGQSFTAKDIPAPKDPYALSKYEAEMSLLHIARETGMEVVIIRPPLVYGPKVKANFNSMMQCLKRGIPLPLLMFTQNKRSLVALDNLIDLIIVCLSHPAAANQIFLVSDGDDLSTANLLQRTASALGKRAMLFSIPPILLKFIAKILGKDLYYKRLSGSLQIDITKTQQLLDWKPPISVDEGLIIAAKGFS